jgi:hypothetical protein
MLIWRIITPFWQAVRLLFVGQILGQVAHPLETVSKVAKYAIVVGRVPDCAKRKKKPDTDLSAFYVTPSVTPEADLLTCGTASLETVSKATNGMKDCSYDWCRY